jgi:formylglycine-generating enzyme required for sulfatase activity/acetyl esterase/lipase
MKFPTWIFALGLLAALPLRGADAPLTINVWPGLPPGDQPDRPGVETLDPKTMLLTGAVNTPTLTVFRPDKDKDTGAAILVCPGGGFYQLSMRDEGTAVGSWLASIGVTGVVLKYRIPNREGMPRYMAALQDAQRSMSIIRSKVAEWGLDPKRIGILGFSAGGQVAADVETNFDKRMYDPIDDIDKSETRPDFAALIYPGGIFARNANPPGLSADVHVSKTTPPTFLDQSTDDHDGSENVVYMYLALKNAGVPAELHVFGEGGHGYGIRPGTAPHATWPARLQDWMTFRGYLKAKPASAAPAPAATTTPAAATAPAVTGAMVPYDEFADMQYYQMKGNNMVALEFYDGSGTLIVDIQAEMQAGAPVPTLHVRLLGNKTGPESGKFIRDTEGNAVYYFDVGDVDKTKLRVVYEDDKGPHDLPMAGVRDEPFEVEHRATAPATPGPFPPPPPPVAAPPAPTASVPKELTGLLAHLAVDPGINLVLIPGGTFMMGSVVGEADRGTDEGPQTQVTLTKDFFLGATDVTQGQYETVMGTNPSDFKAVGKDAPVETVSWQNAMTFCQKLTDRERAAGRLPSGYVFTLPTEAQWEYACRAGTTDPYAGDPAEMSWYGDNSGGKTHPVATKQPNAWGLYDMSGNVYQWCLDWYGKYPGGAVSDWTGPATGNAHVLRGGAWYYEEAYCRSAYRDYDPGFVGNILGFRVALVSTAKEASAAPTALAASATSATSVG